MNTTYINAGAGSGKTYQLTHELADKLIRQDNPVDASRVILTTFTKAAAEDFKKKAREVLIKEKLNPAIAAELDNAMIGTVHSVCESFVKKYWYRLGLTLPLNLIPGEDKELFISRTAENVASDEDVKFFRKFAQDYEMNPDFWKDYLKGIIELKYSFGVDSLQESCDESCRDIASIFTNDATGDEEILDKFLNKIVSAIDEANRPRKANGQKEQLISEHKTAHSLLVGAALYKKALKVQAWVCEGKQKTKGFWKDTFDESTYTTVEDAAKGVFLSKKVGDDCQACVKKLFELVKNWEREYQRFKDENSLLDFNDLEQKFLRILYEDGFEDVRQDISSSYDLLMVDEFQDSNPVQIKVFKKLMELVDETVFVGDRKQAIFGFRGTESTLVDDFIERIPTDHHKSLKRSYRSRPELVNAANDVFCTAFGRQKLPVYPDDDTKPYDGVSLAPTRPGHKEMEPALQHWNIPRSKDDAYFAVGKKIRELVEAKTVLVVRKKDDDNDILEPIQYRDIAILLRNAKFHISDVVQALRDAGVPVSVQEDNFMEWAESQLIVSLIRYVHDKNDRGARADILHLIAGMTTEEIIINCATNRHIDEEQEFFKRLENIRVRISVMSISEIVESLALELDMYANVANWGRSETRSRNIDFMAGLARKYEQQCANMNTAPTLPGYIAYASGYKPEKRPVDKTDTVKVLTCHNAKGLEWPMVILDQMDSLDLSDQHFYKKEFSGVRSYRDNKGGDVLLHVIPSFFSKDTGFGNNTKLPQLLIDNVKKTAFYLYLKSRKVDEESRLLYVAFTRAKDYLVTLGNEKSSYSWPRQCNACVSEYQDGNALLWHQNYPSTYYELQVLPEESNQKVTQPQAWEIPVKIDYRDKYQSPSKHDNKDQDSGSKPVRFTEAFQGKGMVHSIPNDKNEKEDTDSDNIVTRCGTCIHHIFAAYNPDGDKADMVKMADRIIKGMGLTKEFPSPESVIDSATQFFGWLKDAYGEGTALHELPFVNKQKDGTVIRGEMDLVWVLPNGSCVLVDYKSFHGNKELNAIKAHACKLGYPSQLKTYKETLESCFGEDRRKVKDVLIYYFALGKVVKLDV